MLWLGIGVALAVLWYEQPFGTTGGFSVGSLMRCTWEAFVCVGLCVGLLVLFREFVSSPPRLLQMMALNAYGVYIIHVFVVIPLQFAVIGLAAAPLVKFALVVLLAVSISFALAALLRRAYQRCAPFSNEPHRQLTCQVLRTASASAIHPSEIADRGPNGHHVHRPCARPPSTTDAVSCARSASHGTSRRRSPRRPRPARRSWRTRMETDAHCESALSGLEPTGGIDLRRARARAYGAQVHRGCAVLVLYELDEEVKP